MFEVLIALLKTIYFNIRAGQFSKELLFIFMHFFERGNEGGMGL